MSPLVFSPLLESCRAGEWSFREVSRVSDPRLESGQLYYGVHRQEKPACVAVHWPENSPSDRASRSSSPMRGASSSASATVGVVGFAFSALAGAGLMHLYTEPATRSPRRWSRSWRCAASRSGSTAWSRCGAPSKATSARLPCFKNDEVEASSSDATRQRARDTNAGRRPRLGSPPSRASHRRLLSGGALQSVPASRA